MADTRSANRDRRAPLTVLIDCDATVFVVMVDPPVLRVDLFCCPLHAPSWSVPLVSMVAAGVKCLELLRVHETWGVAHLRYRDVH